ncbi:MAG: 50S ribosomal protein L21 [Firmicutes bacterium]|nr:50S ribosomal protein L21 [Bacillota bacterium]
MYAIIKTGGKQYRVEIGTRVRIEKLELEPGTTHKPEVVLSVKDGKISQKGTVTVKVLEHGLGDKIDIFKYKAKKNYRRRQGHRQPFTLVEVTEIK